MAYYLHIYGGTSKRIKFMIKKEFKRKDVDRMRNLIKGKAGSSSEVQIGYNKKQVKYKEGDVWKEGRKTWTIKKGIKQTISKLDNIKKQILTPLCCPKCSKVMKSDFDKHSYRIHKNCHDCVVKFEHKLRLKSEGKYKEYIKSLKQKNNIEYLDEIESYLLDIANSSNSGFVSEDGVVERWVGGINKSDFKKDLIKSVKIKKSKILNNEDN